MMNFAVIAKWSANVIAWRQAIYDAGLFEWFMVYLLRRNTRTHVIKSINLPLRLGLLYDMYVPEQVRRPADRARMVAVGAQQHLCGLHERELRR